MNKALSLLFLIALGLGFAARPAPAKGFEVWAIDQSDAATGGAKLYIYEGSSLEGTCDAVPEVIDLAALGGGVRPHMLLFNQENTHAIIAHTQTDTLYIMNAEARTLVANLRLESHAAVPTPDSTMIIAVEPGHKKVTRIRSDYATDSYIIDGVLDLAPFEAQTGGTAGPICPAITADSKHAYVTLNGGGLLVVDIKSTPMRVVDVYTTTEIAPNGCGGLLNSDGTRMYINSGPPDPAVADHLYVFDTTKIGTRPLPRDLVLPGNDNHGAFLGKHGRFLWTANRDSNEFVVLDTRTDEIVHTVPAALRGRPNLDAAPDLMDVSPAGNRAFVSLRGQRPRSANNPNFNNAVGNAPGVGVLQIEKGGEDGRLRCIAPIRSAEVDGVEQTDIHALRLRVKE